MEAKAPRLPLRYRPKLPIRIPKKLLLLRNFPNLRPVSV